MGDTVVADEFGGPFSYSILLLRYRLLLTFAIDDRGYHEQVRRHIQGDDLVE